MHLPHLRIRLPRIPRPHIPLPKIDIKAKWIRIRKARIPLAKIALTIESVIILYFSLSPTVPATGLPSPRLGDIEHYLAYLLYGFLLIGVYYAKEKRWLFPVLAIGANFSFITEVLQLLVPTRLFDPIDWVTNMLGISTAILVMYAPRFRKHIPKIKAELLIPEIALTLPKLPHIPLPHIRKKKQAEPEAPPQKEEKIELTDDPEKA